jgi:hypothetical protein
LGAKRCPQQRGNKSGTESTDGCSVPETIQPILLACEASEMRLEVCHLTKREAHKLEHRQSKPNCAHHLHVGLEEAFRLVNSQKARWVKVGWSIVCEVFHWAAKMSGGMKVMQLVEGDIPGREPGHKYPIGAHGAKGRNTQTDQTNGRQLQNENGRFIPVWVR